MKKSVYSLVLMDDVVEAIDRMAYSMNTSRSNLINQILAERVSYVTPEMRMRDIFSRILYGGRYSIFIGISVATALYAILYSVPPL